MRPLVEAHDRQVRTLVKNPQLKRGAREIVTWTRTDDVHTGNTRLVRDTHSEHVKRLTDAACLVVQ